MISTEDLKNVLDSFVAGIENGNKERFKEIASLPAIQEALEAVRQGKPEDFYQMCPSAPSKRSAEGARLGGR